MMLLIWLFICGEIETIVVEANDGETLEAPEATDVGNGVLVDASVVIATVENRGNTKWGYMW